MMNQCPISVGVRTVTQEENYNQDIQEPLLNRHINVICGIEAVYKKFEKYFSKASRYLRLQFY